MRILTLVSVAVTAALIFSSVRFFRAYAAGSRSADERRKATLWRAWVFAFSAVLLVIAVVRLFIALSEN